MRWVTVGPRVGLSECRDLKASIFDMSELHYDVHTLFQGVAFRQR